MISKRDSPPTNCLLRRWQLESCLCASEGSGGGGSPGNDTAWQQYTEGQPTPVGAPCPGVTFPALLAFAPPSSVF